MKKILFSTTMLATAGVFALSAGDAFGQAAAPAAEKMKISVGGFMLQTIGYAKQDDDFERGQGAGQGFSGFDQKSDSEVYFRGSVKLDNGLTVGVDIQLEADTQTAANPALDESYMTIASTTLGTLTLGSTNPAGSDLAVNAPFTGALNPYTGDMTGWIIDPGGMADDMSTNQNSGGGTDDNLVKYVSPSFAGFRVGTSYTPSSTDSFTQPTATESSLWDAGAQYSGKFGDFGVRVSAIYWNQQGAADTAQLDGWAAGADVTFADFTVGGAYGEANDNGTNRIATAATSNSNETWNLGVKYEPGPFALSLTYGRQTADSTALDRDEDSHSRWILGASYTLGPGVALKASVIRLRFDNEANNQTNENSGWAAVGGLLVDF
jgi:predicted porin